MDTVSIGLYVWFGVLLFMVGLWGLLLNRKNVIVIVMSLELMLLAVNVLLTGLSMYLDDIMGQVLAILVITVAAAESSIGLAILVIYYRLHGDIAVTQLNRLKG